MAFEFPKYHAPDFTQELFRSAPDAAWAVVERATCWAARARTLPR